MAASAIVGTVLRPTAKIGAVGPRYVLEEVVPKQFGDWKLQRQAVTQVINPQTQELLDQLYGQVLTRTYVDPNGYEIMLSLAYGDDQRGGLKAHVHKPEICYPAQGFTVDAETEADIATPFGRIAARRLNTSRGQRKEPVSYWVVMSGTGVSFGHTVKQRMVEIRLALTGQVPDGLLFRVSSLDDTPTHAFERQDAFVSDLMKALGPTDRGRLGGLVAPS